MCNKRPALAGCLAGWLCWSCNDAYYKSSLLFAISFDWQPLPVDSEQLPVASCQTLPYAIRPRNIFCMLVA